VSVLCAGGEVSNRQYGPVLQASFHGAFDALKASGEGWRDHGSSIDQPANT
jgi:hypothetical protein